MIWRSMPLASRFSLAYALVFLLAMVAGAQEFDPAPAGSYAAPQYVPPASWGEPVYSPVPRLAARVSTARNHVGPQPYIQEPGVGAYGTLDAGCCDVGACAPVKTVLWGGRVGALLLFRDDENHRFYSYDSADESYQLLDSREGNFDLGPGVEAFVSRFNCCRQCGFEFGYWGIYPDEEVGLAYPGDVIGDLNGIFNFDQLDYNGATADTWVNTAMVHRIRRRFEAHNAEFNFLWGLPLSGGGASPWQFRALAGFRYLRLVDDLEFGSDTANTTFTGAPEELYYTIDVDNDLYGFQLGGIGERRIGASRWSATWGAKAGVYGNQADARSFIGGAAGPAVINNGPNNGRAWDVYAEKSDVAFLGELHAGVGYRIGWNWRLLGEYRVIGISGIALPTNQIYQDLRGLQDVQLLATNGNLILHGAFVGVERAY